MLIAGLDGIYIPSQARGRSFAHTNALSLVITGWATVQLRASVSPSRCHPQKVLMCRERATPANWDTEMKSA